VVKAAGALVRAADPAQAGSRAAAEACAALGSVPSFAVLFASADFLDSAPELVSEVAEHVGRVPLIGCVADGVVGGACEVESGPAVSLWLAADLGPVETFALEFARTSSGGVIGGYRFDRDQAGVYLMICDPFTFPSDDLLAHLNAHVAGTVVMGGLASGGLQLGQSRLFLDDRVLSRGAVGVHLPAGQIYPLVSQGCRPIGEPYTITGADGNVVHELGGRPPLERLRELATSLPDRDRELLGQGLQVGMVINEYQAERRPGDFLIRGVMGADQDTGAIAVGDEVTVGQTLQFQLRDADSADEDLRRTLEHGVAGLAGGQAAGALLFTCNGRGSRMFSAPDHDAGLLDSMLGNVPVAGFFCAGELGPVGDRNYLHGFTASIALFPAAVAPQPGQGH
jgi:small ligand-binding sensory domain FIST